MGKWSCCQHTHCFTWWNHCSFVACYASAKALRGKHCFLHWQGAWSMYVQPPPQGQKKGFCSEAAFTSPVVEFCIMLLSSLWASFGFQSSTASTPRLSVCMSVSPSAKLILFLLLFSQPIKLVWICSSFQFVVVKVTAFCNKMSLQRSPDTATGKAQRVKISLEIYTMEFYFIHCVFWGTKGHYS